MIDLGAYVHAQDLVGRSPLYYLVRSLPDEWHRTLPEVLRTRRLPRHLRHPVLYMDILGMNALHAHIVESSHPPFKLRQANDKEEAGAAIEAPDRCGRDGLLLACNRGDSATITYILTTTSQLIMTSDYMGANALHYAARSGDLKSVEIILSQLSPLQLTSMDNVGRSYYWYAQRGSNPDIISLLQSQVTEQGHNFFLDYSTSPDWL